MPLPTHRAQRVRAAVRQGSSLPILVETEAGVIFTKLRGAAQGPAALVAEIIVARLAEALGLRVPRRSLVWLPPGIESDDRPGELHDRSAGWTLGQDELRDLLDRSAGWNLGFEHLPGARDLRADQAGEIDPDTAAAILWLDRLVMNPDRTAKNPNLLRSRGVLWLIDHGAALGFHHDLPRLTEDVPRRPDGARDHLLLAHAAHLPQWDPILAEALGRDVLRAAAAEVPDDLLLPLVSGGAPAAARRRETYVAFLWKRLRPPRPWAEPPAR